MSKIELLSIYVPNPSTIRGVSTKLSSSKDGSKLAYGSGKSAIILPIVTTSTASNQSTQPIVFPSPHPITVVKISPSSYYAASGDASGTLKIFSLDHAQGTPPIIKFEAKPLSKINDIDWDSESKRFLCGGEGREGFGAVFSFETGSSIGVIGGHNKTINSVSMKGGRPFKAVTASDDNTLCFHTGVPFKFESQSRKHSKFVQSTDYSHDGTAFISAGSDGKLFIYEGLKGECTGEFVDESVGVDAAHKGTIFSASFSGDSKSIATSSADGTVKLWNATTRSLIQTWKLEQGTSIESQQVGNCFLGNSTIVSLSFSGILSFLEAGSDKPIRIINGHQTSITTLALSSNGDIYTGDASGHIRQFNSKGDCSIVSGSGHASRIVAMVSTSDGVATVSYDDSVRFIEEGSGFSSASISTGSLSKALTCSTQHLFLATTKDIQSTSLSTKKIVSTLPIPYSATSIAVTKNGSIVAVGSEDAKVYLYEHADTGFKLLGTCELRNQVTALAFNPSDQKFLAVGESTGKVLLFDVEKRELILSRWVYQSGRISSLSWKEDGKFIASASLDQSIFVYSVDKPSEVVSAKNVHSGGVAQIVWSINDELISVGADACIKKFNIKLSA